MKPSLRAPRVLAGLPFSAIEGPSTARHQGPSWPDLMGSSEPSSPALQLGGPTRLPAHAGVPSRPPHLETPESRASAETTTEAFDANRASWKVGRG